MSGIEAADCMTEGEDYAAEVASWLAWCEGLVGEGVCDCSDAASGAVVADVYCAESE